MTACGPLWGPIAGGAESLPLPEASARFWAAVPPLWKTGSLRPGLFTEDEK